MNIFVRMCAVCGRIVPMPRPVEGVYVCPFCKESSESSGRRSV